MPEWLDRSAKHGTEKSYKARERMMELQKSLGYTRYASFTDHGRRSTPGDAGSLLKLHTILTQRGMINADALNKSTPTPVVFTNKEQRQTPVVWSKELIQAVAWQARKGPPIEWEQWQPRLA